MIMYPSAFDLSLGNYVVQVPSEQPAQGVPVTDMVHELLRFVSRTVTGYNYGGQS